MKLYQYLHENQVLAIDIASAAGVSNGAISKIKNEVSTPGLLTAMKVYALTEGEVELIDMLNGPDRLEYERFLKSQAQ